MKLLGVQMPFGERKSVTERTINTAQQLAEVVRQLFSSKSGQSVTYWTALQVSTVLACTRVICDGLASMPLKLYEPDGKGIRAAVEHPLYDLVAFKPNDIQTSGQWRSGMTAMMVLAGNGYSEITRGVARQPRELLPYLPSQIEVEQEGWILKYKVRTQGGGERIIDPANILPLRGPGFGGLIGADIVRLARETIGLHLAAEEYQAQQAATGTRIPGYLSVQLPGKSMGKDEKKELGEAWKEKFGGVKQSSGVPILEGEIEWKEVSQQTNQEAQTIETRKFLIEDTCRGLGVFPQMVGVGGSDAATKASAEQFFTAHVVHTLLPRAVLWEQTLDRFLLTPEDRSKGRFFKHSLQGMLRGDNATRAQFYKSMRESAIMSVNEIRVLEEMNPLDEAFDDPRLPLNTNPLPANSTQNPGDKNAA